MSADRSDPLHHAAVQDHHWTTTNIGEAIPGVQTPLSWSVWRPVGVALRDVGRAAGALTRAEHADRDGLMEAFYGRAAFRVDPFALLGDRLPGTSGQEVVETLLGRVPQDFAFGPSRRRYPIIAVRFPATFLATPGRVRRRAREMDEWDARRLDEVRAMDLDAARETLLEAQRTLVEMVSLQTVAALAVVQPLHDALDRLVRRAGVGDVGVLGGGGGAEMVGLVGDIWKASRGELNVPAVVARHGFHGPLEGELSSRVWRDDPGPLLHMVDEYRARPDSEDPAARGQSRERERVATAARLLAALPGWQRPPARLLLRLAAEHIPLRGVAKRSLLQAFDIARAAARRIGVLLAADGALSEADDVFHLTLDEVLVPPPDAPALVAERRERRAAYQRLSLPSDWRGAPEPIAVDPGAGEACVVEGLGVSAGVVEGRVRVVLSPEFGDVEPDEVLVAPTTDPSWASIMFISAALVVDIGGALSHTAVVAREIGIPCVVNTRTGTRRLRTGDRVRVDGDTGVVEVLERAPAAAAPVTTPG